MKQFLLSIAVISALLASYITAIASQKVAPIAPVTDLLADSMEITQGIQDRNNSVPLVKGKRTFVRLYVHSTNGIYPTTATLRVAAGALTQTMLPIAPGGPLINVRPTYNRVVPSHAFLFELPLWATVVDEVTLTAEVNPDLRWRPRNPEEFSYANNILARTASFDPVPKLHLVIADQPYTFNNVTYTVSPIDRWKAVEWLSRVYPLGQVKVYFRTLPTLKATRKLDDNNNWDLTFPYCSWLNLYLANNRAAIFGNPFIPKTAAFYAIVPDDIGFMRGCANVGGMLTAAGFARTGSGPVGAGDWGWDFDGSYADWYTGHEVGHSFGRPHVRGGPGYVEDGCGGEAGAYKHYPNGRISPTVNIFDPTAIFGFDTLRLIQKQNPILGPNWSDVMTYCDYQWMSKTTYLKLKEAFEFYLPNTPGNAQWNTPAEAEVDPVLGIFGTLDPSTDEVMLLPVFVLSSETVVSPPEPGPYAVVLRAAGGAQLARYPFVPGDLDGGPSPDGGVEEGLSTISLLLPDTAGIASLEIEGPGGVIFQVEAGLNLPAVQVASPNGGEIFGQEDITVSWTASDPDDDPLTFNIDYSADNGNSWEPVAQYITETQVTIDQINLPASDMALFKVSASDGIHTSSDTSDAVFFIPNHPPTGEIISPEDGTTVASGQTISFQGQVYDYDLGMLEDGDLEWWSDRDGLLGNGSILSTAVLSQGLHEINLVADDGHGPALIDQVVVSVVSTPNDLSPQPNALVAGPDLVFLYPVSGIPSGVIYLDNQNLGEPIAWSVSSDADWAQLSLDSGLTPQEITVSTNLTAADIGTHKALLTFTDPDGLYEPVFVVVTAIIPEYGLFLPLVTR